MGQKTKKEMLMADMKKQFEAASAAVLKAKKDPGNDMKLKLYAHFKQATEGDVAGDKPGFTDFVNRAKYEAWAKLKGMSSEEAMKAYVKLAERVTRE
jgi:diazepam-binding inhibitor (GABA receptor modulating acyl-CoA-binding protein)